MRMAGSAMASMFGDQQSPRYDELSNIGIQGRSQERTTATAADAQARMSDINADATTQMAKINADATKAAGQAAGQSAMISGIASGISGIAGGLGSMGTSGGATPASSAGISLSSNNPAVNDWASGYNFKPSFSYNPQYTLDELIMRKAGLALSDFDFSGINVTGPSTGGDGGKMATAWKSVRSNSPHGS